MALGPKSPITRSHERALPEVPNLPAGRRGPDTLRHRRALDHPSHSTSGLYAEGLRVKGFRAGEPVCEREMRFSCLHGLLEGEDSVGWETAAAQVIEGRQATRPDVGPPARNGSWRVRMYQIAPASSRASLLPRCLPSRRLVRS